MKRRRVAAKVPASGAPPKTFGRGGLGHPLDTIATVADPRSNPGVLSFGPNCAKVPKPQQRPHVGFNRVSVMASTNQARSLQLVLAHEGGYVNHPDDPGGATNKGVTQRVYDAYRTNKGLGKRSVRSITQAEVAEIYDRQYWDEAWCDKLPAGLDYAVFDYAVNSGVNRALKDLQRTLNANANYFGVSGKLSVDGVFGNATETAVNSAANADEEALIVQYCERRMKFLKSLKNYRTFGKGWFRRVMGDYDGSQDTDKGVIDLAVMMARDDLAYPVPKAVLPAAIGSKDGEVAAKAPEAKQAALKTTQGVGSALAAAGASGQTVIAAAQQVQPHIGDTFFGRLALIGFVVLILLGVGLVTFDWFRKQQEKASA